jgi:hypothetical protein
VLEQTWVKKWLWGSSVYLVGILAALLVLGAAWGRLSASAEHKLSTMVLKTAFPSINSDYIRESYSRFSDRQIIDIVLDRYAVINPQAPLLGKEQLAQAAPKLALIRKLHYFVLHPPALFATAILVVWLIPVCLVYCIMAVLSLRRMGKKPADAAPGQPSAG